jgi:hypothetical protein
MDCRPVRLRTFALRRGSLCRRIQPALQLLPVQTLPSLQQASLPRPLKVLRHTRPPDSTRPTGLPLAQATLQQQTQHLLDLPHTESPCRHLPPFGGQNVTASEPPFAARSDRKPATLPTTFKTWPPSARNRWPPSRRNPWPDSLGIPTEINFNTFLALTGAMESVLELSGASRVIDACTRLTTALESLKAVNLSEIPEGVRPEIHGLVAILAFPRGKKSFAGRRPSPSISETSMRRRSLISRGVKPKTVREWRTLGTGPAYRNEAGIRYPVRELWTWRQKGRQTITAQRVRRGRAFDAVESRTRCVQPRPSTERLTLSNR